MDCPRCKLMLRATDYEGIEVDVCDNCWGMWLDTGELKRVIDARGMTFSDAERKQFAQFRGGAAPARGAGAVACPRCGRDMEQVQSDTAIRLEVDRCPEHGVWLDTGEIKDLQVFMEEKIARKR